MRLYAMKDGALSLLKNNIEHLESKYLESTPFIDSYFQERNEIYFSETNIEVDTFELLNGIENDAKNAVIIHKAMKNLQPIHAREEKIWAYLTHTKYWKYMESRWSIKDCKKHESTISRIRSRYFFESNTDKIIGKNSSYMRNGLSRLWWVAHTLYNQDCDNHYEYIDEAFVSQDLMVGIFERDIAHNKELVLSILKCVRKYDIRNLTGRGNLIRNIIKDINFSAGLIMYESLSTDLLEEAIEKIFEKNIIKIKKKDTV